jgi:hypothetical protein
LDFEREKNGNDIRSKNECDADPFSCLDQISLSIGESLDADGMLAANDKNWRRVA